MKIRSNLDVSKTITSASFASRVQTVSGASGTVEVDATLGSIINISTIDETVLTIINPIVGVTYTLNITGSLTFEGSAYTDTVVKVDYDGSWNVLIGEAPTDGNQYARKDGGWIVVESGDTSKWEPELVSAATEVHPRWNESPDPSVYGLDTFGFNANGTGNRGASVGSYAVFGYHGELWTSTEDIATGDVWIRRPIFVQSNLIRGVLHKENGFGVRLVRDYVIGDGVKEDGRILPSAFTDNDGNTYDGVIIGDQVWSTKNLSTTTYLNGDPIPTGFNDTDWTNLTSGAYAVYDHTLVTGINSEQEMIDAYGILYNWYVVDDVRGLSSEGHVPTDAEFTQLTDYLIATYPEITEANVGDHLKSVRQVNSPYEYESGTLIRPKDGKKVDASHIEGLEQGGHTILDPDENAMPTQPALRFGAGFTVTDETGQTVVGNTAVSHVDGAVEEKHQTNQVYEGSTPLSTILPKLVNLADIDMSDIIVGEKKILVAEKGSDGLPQFGGAIGLLDVLAPPTLDTLLDESNPLWIGDYITLTGDNRQGQLGENSQFFEKNGDLFLCKSHNNGTTALNGSATWARNRGQDCLKPESIALHATIVGQLETEAGWNAIAQFKQIAAESKRGSWFRRSTGGYLFMCIDDANGWTRVGTPPTIELEITTASHPNLTTSLAAHDFTANRFYVEGTNTTDEPASQGQEWWDTANKYVYRRNMNGNWTKLN